MRKPSDFDFSQFLSQQEPPDIAYAGASGILGTLLGVAMGYAMATGQDQQQPVTSANPYRNQKGLTVQELEAYLMQNHQQHPKFHSAMQQLAQLPPSQPVTKQLAADLLG